MDWIAEYKRRIKERLSLPKVKKETEERPRADFIVVKWVNSEIPKVVGTNLTYKEARILAGTQQNRVLNCHGHEFTIQYQVHHKAEVLEANKPSSLL